MGPKQNNPEERLAELTVLLNDLYDDILETFNLGNDLSDDPRQKKSFQAKISRLDGIFERFIFNMAEAKSLADKMELTADREKLSVLTKQTRSAYYECLTIDVCNSVPISNPTEAIDTKVLQPPIKLPTIQLPKFNGNVSDWICFKDTFSSLIHVNTHLSEIDKFHYLRSSLQGPALQAISSISLHAANYNQAWLTICKRFDNERIRANHHLMKLLSFRPCSKQTLEAINQFSEIFIESAQSFLNMKLKKPEEFILCTLGLRCLDPKTRERFETEVSNNAAVPTFADFTNFIDRQQRQIQTELLNSIADQNKTFENANFPSSRTPRHVLIASSSDESVVRPCPHCQKNHRIYTCPSFLDLSPPDRVNVAKQLRLCYNCLTPGHNSPSCASSHVCRHCKKTHHTLLHLRIGEHSLFSPYNGSRKPGPEQAKESRSGGTTHHVTRILNSELSPSGDSGNTSDAIVLLSAIEPDISVLLGTARAKVRGADGQYYEARILLDCASQRSCITASFAKKLGLPKFKNSQILKGFQESPILGGEYQIKCLLSPLQGNHPELKTNAVIFPKITTKMPLSPLPAQVRQQYHSLALSDPDYWSPLEVDLLLGADIVPRILTGDNVTYSDSYPSAIGTIFGYVLMGTFMADHCSPQTVMTLSAVQSPVTLDTLISNFWQLESVPVPSKSALYSREEKSCEEHFRSTHSRDDNGRYIVRLPLGTNPMPNLKDSADIARKRFSKLEYRLQRDQPVRQEYSRIIQEYIDQEYISPAAAPGKYFLPHHCVVKNDASSTKVRIVFDGSATAKEGSLNQHLLTGPKLQLDIRCVLLNFRQFPIAFAADITQMYSQISVHPSDRCYQHFFYRSEVTQAIQEYSMNRVTFGLSCSPFLAIRVLHQLTEDEGNEFPAGSKVLLENTYVDDILAGAQTEKEAWELKTELIHLLKKGCFQLKKWSSNSDKLLKNPNEINTDQVKGFPMDDSSVKILGLQWDTKNDCLLYKIHELNVICTKRGVLSAIARMYDPLGYLSPVLFCAKLFMQRLWQEQLGWDDALPPGLAKQCTHYFKTLTVLSQVTLPRCIFPSKPLSITLIGFADASTSGYAAVVYLRMEFQNKSVDTHLIISKTRLAPLKTITVPRLELCAVVLLVQALESIAPFLKNLTIDKTFLFTDSTITLSWLKIPPNRLKTFVAHRVSTITESYPEKLWFHVASEHNAADLASRGANPNEFLSNSTWWKGPAWLLSEENQWPISSLPEPIKVNEIPEVKGVENTIVLMNQSTTADLVISITKYSSFSKAVRVFSYIKRFVTNCRKRAKKITINTGCIKLSEIKRSTLELIRMDQTHYFPQANWHQPHLLSLSPFIVSAGLVRVGGRLKNSPLRDDAKNPILLHPKSYLTRLMIDHFHRSYLHAGPTLLQSLLFAKYWIVSGRRIIRQRTHQCLTCHRFRVKNFSVVMADLPKTRFTSGRAFLTTGVDFAGPFILKESQRRKAATQKAYIALFVCLSSKAVHLEVVSNLTTENFCAALERFIARRGIPSRIMSDNGLNFVGAQRQLEELYKWLRDPTTEIALQEHLHGKEIKWEFIPPASPHFGGIWEAGVKSMKHHLRRVAGNQVLTFEELMTLSAKIEAMMNSRPLHAISSDPENFNVLTPGHFLIGEPMVAIPEEHLLDVPDNRLTRWHLLKKNIQDIWNRWRLEYLNSLQQKKKWTTEKNNIELGSLVLVKDPKLPPLAWPTARIIDVYPGNDGVVRVVRIRTPTGEYVRPIVKLAPLLPPSD